MNLKKIFEYKLKRLRFIGGMDEVKSIEHFSTWFNPNCAIVISSNPLYKNVSLVIHENSPCKRWPENKFVRISKHFLLENAQKEADLIKEKLNSDNPICALTKESNILPLDYLGKKYSVWKEANYPCGKETDKNNPDNYFRPLDIVKVNRGFYNHTAIYLGNRKVAHLSDPIEDKSESELEVEDKAISSLWNLWKEQLFLKNEKEKIDATLGEIRKKHKDYLVSKFKISEKVEWMLLGSILSRYQNMIWKSYNQGRIKMFESIGTFDPFFSFLAARKLGIESNVRGKINRKKDLGVRIDEWEKFVGKDKRASRLHWPIPFKRPQKIIEHIKKAALSEYNKGKYHLIDNNCEHFCHMCVNGVSYSKQSILMQEINSGPLQTTWSETFRGHFYLPRSVFLGWEMEKNDKLFNNLEISKNLSPEEIEKINKEFQELEARVEIPPKVDIDKWFDNKVW